MASVLLIGGGSFLAQSVQKAPADNLDLHVVRHDADLSAIDFDAYDVVTNFAYDPSTMRGVYDETRDFDLRVARAMAPSRARFILLSTRRVYGPTPPFPADEEAPLAPADHYGRNKATTEAAIRALLGERATVLRVANVFGFEPGRHTFFGIALRTLRDEGRIILDTSPFVRRDFIPLDEFAKVFRRVAADPPSGVFNLGSGQATALGHIALWIIEGYGRGELVVTSPAERDSFLLDSTRLAVRIGDYRGALDIRRSCFDIGRSLRDV